jgi:hypothetical protein
MRNHESFRKQASDAIVARHLPNWFRIFFFVNLSFFVTLTGVAILSPKSVNLGEMTIVSLYLVLFTLISGRVQNKNRTLSPEEVSKL